MRLEAGSNSQDFSPCFPRVSKADTMLAWESHCCWNYLESPGLTADIWRCNPLCQNLAILSKIRFYFPLKLVPTPNLFLSYYECDQPPQVSALNETLVRPSQQPGRRRGEQGSDRTGGSVQSVGRMADIFPAVQISEGSNTLSLSSSRPWSSTAQSPFWTLLEILYFSPSSFFFFSLSLPSQFKSFSLTKPDSLH